METKIVVTYRAVDGFRKRAQFKTLKGAQAFAQKWIGATPELGGSYAVSGDGVGKIAVDGDAKVADLFPKLAPSASAVAIMNYEGLPTDIDCPRDCGWPGAPELDEDGRPYTCFYCYNRGFVPANKETA